MKFRRRFATSGRLARVWSHLVQRLDLARRTDRTPSDDTSASDQLAEPALPAAPDAPPSITDADAPVRPVWNGLRSLRWPWPRPSPRALRMAGIFAGTFAVGYLFAAIILFPAPFLTSSRSVPRVLGISEGNARDALQAAGFGVGAMTRVPHAHAPAGTVVGQDPPPDVVAPAATEVALTLSAGPQRVPVPDIAGYDADDARQLIEGAGLRIGSTESTQAPTPRNVAVNTRPPAGTALPPGSEIVLVVSVGAATIRVPQLTGLTVAEARLALEVTGLALGTAFAQTTNSVAPGEIFYQEPSAGTLSAPGTVVNVRFARRP